VHEGNNERCILKKGENEPYSSLECILGVKRLRTQSNQHFNPNSSEKSARVSGAFLQKLTLALSIFDLFFLSLLDRSPRGGGGGGLLLNKALFAEKWKITSPSCK